MKRRDTIIIAVLLNAGLLIVLFASSLKTEITESSTPPVVTVLSPDPKDAIASSQVPASNSSEPVQNIDQILNRYATPIVGEDKSSFTDDLQAIGSSNDNPVNNTPKIDSIAPLSQPAVIEIRVKKGDVLERIARTYHVSVDSIMKANRLTSSNLKIGQMIKIPTNNPIRSPQNQNVPASTAQGEGGPKYYTVKSGDNPWVIAVKHHMKVEELLKLNNMNSEKDAKNLKPGDQLRVK
jgi:peptidoglycan endopeptidase LytF